MSTNSILAWVKEQAEARKQAVGAKEQSNTDGDSKIVDAMDIDEDAPLTTITQSTPSAHKPPLLTDSPPLTKTYLLFAVKSYKENGDCAAAGIVREVARALFGQETVDEQLLSLGVNIIPRQQEVEGGSKDGLEMLKNAWENAKALEPEAVADMLKSLAERIHGKGVLA